MKRHIDLVWETLDAAATLREVPRASVSAVIGERIERCEFRIEGKLPEAVSLQWTPEGGGIVEKIDVAPALAHHLRYDAQRLVSKREHDVTLARRALDAAEKAHAEAVALRDRLAAIVDEGVADARALRAQTRTQ
jgi:hypothetical protein